MKRGARPQPNPADAARLGEELREAREAQGWSIDDLAANLRIRRVYLIALEEGRVRDLPAPAYAIGFVRSYARTLGLDDDAMVRRFREASGPVTARKTDLVFPEPVPDRGVPAGAVVLLGAVLAVGAYVGWYQWSGNADRVVDAVPAPPPRAEPVAATAPPVVSEPPPPPPASAPVAAPGGAPRPAGAPGPGGTIAAAPTTGGAVPAAPPAVADAGRIALRARGEAWVQVRERAGPVVLNRVLRAGESWSVPARDGLLLSTGNVGGLDVVVDGQVAPWLGSAQAVRRDVPLDADRLKAGIPAAPAVARSAPPSSAPSLAAPP